jgi:integrase
MPRVSRMQLHFNQWPAEDRERWNEAFRPGDLFEEDRRGTHLSQATRNALRVSYAQWLRFLSENYPDLLDKAPEARVDRELTAFGFRVGPHRFRHAAGTLWSIEDPENVRGVKDLLGHVSFDKTTETYYVASQSRIAGRALAKAIEAATD